MEILIPLLIVSIIFIAALIIFIVIKFKDLNIKSKIEDTSLTLQIESLKNQISQINNSINVNNIKTLEASSKHINDLYKIISEQNKENTEFVRKNIDQIKQTNDFKLNELKEVVNEKLSISLSKNIAESFKPVSDQLTNLYKELGEIKKMNDSINSFNQIMSNVKTRGTWAELQLKTILDEIIPTLYVENFNVDGKFVEFAIKIPSENNHTMYLPLDSKFPIEDYLRLQDAKNGSNMQIVKELKLSLENKIFNHCKDISKYIKPPLTLPYAVMYLPTEGLFAEVMTLSSTLIEDIKNKYNIMIVGPTTVVALLNALSLGFKTLAINDKAQEIAKLLSAVKSQFEKFDEQINKSNKYLEQASKAFSEVSKRNKQINNKLKSIESLSLDDSNKILEIDETINIEYEGEN